MTPDSRRSWLVATVGAFAMIFTFGTPLSYGIFREPFSETFRISPVAMSTVFSVMLFTFFIGSGIVGMLSVRFPARVVLLGSAGATGLISPSLYLVDSYLGLLVVFAVLGLTLGTAFVLITSIVPRWFDEYRGAATGLIFVGNGLGLFILPPLWQRSFTELGIRQGFFLIMSMTTVMFLLAGLVCRRPRWAAQSEGSTREIVVWVARLAAQGRFRQLFVGIGLTFAWYQLLAAYAVDLFVDRGLTATTASTVFGLIGGVSIISRVGGGFLADRFGSRRAFLASLCCASLGIALLVLPQYSVMAVGVVLIGLGLGGCATLYVPVVMTVYPPEKDTAVIGVFNIAGGVGSLAMPPLGVISIAYTENYLFAILLTFVVTLAAFCLVVSGTANSQQL